MPPQDDKPTEPGGGTVFYVTEEHHRFLSNRVEREEGGTPNLVGDVKLGLVLHIHSSVGVCWIEEEELRISMRMHDRLRSIDRLVLLGRKTGVGRHLPIFSFLIRFGNRFLHFNFVCALLNDLFGIQSRGGCSCAGPMSQDILGMSSDVNKRIELALLDKHEVLRPGYTRISFPYWVSEDELNYVVDAIQFIAEHGWCFLPVYKYNPKTGEWAHLSRMTKFPERIWLSNFKMNHSQLLDGQITPNSDSNFEILMHNAYHELDEAKRNKELIYRISQHQLQEDLVLGSRNDLRWFTALGDVNSATAQALTTLVGPLNPNKWQRNGDSIAEDKESPDDQGTAFANLRSTQKMAARSTYRNNQSIPRYMDLHLVANSSRLESSTNKGSAEGNKAGVSCEHQYDADGKQKCLPLAVQKSDEQSTATPTGGFIRNYHEKPADGKLLPGQGAIFNATKGSQMKAIEPPKKIMKLVGQAIKEWSMIEDGDRLLLGLSGGKDSLALLHVLIALQKRAPIKFEISCCTIDPQTASYDPSPLIPYVNSLGITYHYMSEPIIELAKTKMQGDSLCAFCARFKRGLLYSTCRTHGYNKLVLAQHLDDLAESFYM